MCHMHVRIFSSIRSALKALQEQQEETKRQMEQRRQMAMQLQARAPRHPSTPSTRVHPSTLLAPRVCQCTRRPLHVPFLRAWRGHFWIHTLCRPFVFYLSLAIDIALIFRVMPDTAAVGGMPHC